jgi:hypothetical protein
MGECDEPRAAPTSSRLSVFGQRTTKPFAGGGANGFCTLASAERRVQRSGTGFSVVVSVSGCGVEVRVCFQASLLACWLGDGWGSWVRGSDLIGVGG